MRMIQISVPMVSSHDADKALAHMGNGREFSTDNGEISDAMARTIAGWYQSPWAVGSMLAALASGCRVRVPGWPVELDLGTESLHTRG